MISEVIKRSGVVVAFNPERITNAIYRAAVAVGGRDRSISENLTKQVIDLLLIRDYLGYIPTVEEIQDAVEKVLIENGHAKVAKAYILYRDERSRLRRRRSTRIATSENIPWAKIWHILDWSVDHGVNSISGLNNRISRGEYQELVHEGEKAYGEDIESASEMVFERKDHLRMVIVTGPSSSGKTTSTIKISMRLKRMGLTLVTLNVDNYFYDLELHPRDEFGDYDFETPQALDLPLLNQHLGELVNGQEVSIPFYDFKSGHRILDHSTMKLADNDLIILDSLHGMYPEMTQSVPEEQKIKIYLEPLLQMKDETGEYIRWTDIRLVRRMLRDAVHRAYDPRQTLEHWHYVRSSEMRNIISHIDEADYLVNTAMPHELPIYVSRMLGNFAQWVDEYKDDPLREDAYERALRIYSVLQKITPIEDDSVIPTDSVLREFLGGSCYQ